MARCEAGFERPGLTLFRGFARPPWSRRVCEIDHERSRVLSFQRSISTSPRSGVPHDSQEPRRARRGDHVCDLRPRPPRLGGPRLRADLPQEAEVTEFTSSWGAARAGHSHKGNDLMAPKGTEVSAAADGVVVFVRDRGSAGRYVAIDHGDGWETWYMHLNNDNPGTDDG